jgi:hypothetical protein
MVLLRFLHALFVPEEHHVEADKLDERVNEFLMDYYSHWAAGYASSWRRM